MLQQSIDLIPKFSEASAMYRDLLKQQHDEISHILRTLEIPKRHARSIDFIGSALKFVAGTPDHDDYKFLLTQQNFLIENNNRQTKINSVLQNRINEITNQINKIRFLLGKQVSGSERTPLFEYLANRNNLMISYMNNIALSIVLAKNGLINPLILDDLDIDSLVKIENLPISISNLLSATKIRILQNNNIIHYILKIPKISKFCDFLNLYPVSHNDTIVKLPVKNAAKCDVTTYPVSECTRTTTENICKPFTSICLSEIMNNNTASCPTEDSYHLKKIQIVDDGIIILNEVFPTIISERDNITVTGTILLTFTESIRINGSVFQAKNNITRVEAHPPKTISLKILEHENKISLQYLHKLNIENTNLIQATEDNLNYHATLWWSASSVMTIIIIAFIAVWAFKHICNSKPRLSPQPEFMSQQELKIMVNNIEQQDAEDVVI